VTLLPSRLWMLSLHPRQRYPTVPGSELRNPLLLALAIAACPPLALAQYSTVSTRHRRPPPKPGHPFVLESATASLLGVEPPVTVEHGAPQRLRSMTSCRSFIDFTFQEPFRTLASMRRRPRRIHLSLPNGRLFDRRIDRLAEEGRVDLATPILLV